MIAFTLFAPALLALPLAGLLLASRPRSAREVGLATFSATIAGWWMVQGGDIADQVLRAAALMATSLFVVASTTTRASVVHRALGSLAGAAAGVVTAFVLLGGSWGELRWTVQRRVGFAAREAWGNWWANVAQASDTAMLQQMERGFDAVVRFMADYYPAGIAIELLAAFALATALLHRIAGQPVGTPLGRLRDFRFSEHLGWAAAVPLAILILPKLSVVKIAAGNVLLVTGSLYALRGIGVAAFGMTAMGGGGVTLGLALALAVVFMLPVVGAGAIVLGVLDAGLDLRRRWATPPARD